MNFRRRIPSLTALMTLEAVLRHRSFTAAAVELGVTQAAVSRQIAVLEDELGQAMFLRKHRAIEPTQSCLVLGTTLAQSFANIADTVDAVRASEQDVVTIGATVAFSSFWLLPRLPGFRRENPGVQIRVISQDAGFDLDAGGVDIAIRYGRPPFSDAKIVGSKEDTIVPVCSPDYLRRRATGALTEADEYVEADAHGRSWLSWSQWCEETGKVLRVKPHLRFSHYTEAIAAARAGQGVALGWKVLVRTFLEDGTLITLDEAEMQTADRYYVLLPARRRLGPSAEHAAEWLSKAISS